METPNESFPPADVDKELNPGHNTSAVEVDPVSSQVAQSADDKEKSEADKKQREKDALQTLKQTIIVSGVLIAVAGALFAITKKLRESK